MALELEQRWYRYVFMFSLLWVFIAPASERIQPVRLKRVVIFGDSLADTGNTWSLTRYLQGVGEKPWFYDSLYRASWGWLPLRFFTGVLPPDIYYKGRFTNGPLSGEWVMPMLGLDPEDPDQVQFLAFGGSWAVSSQRFLSSWLNLWGDDSISTMEWLRHLFGGLGKWVLPSSSEVVDWYLEAHKELDKDTMFVLFSGANDYQNHYWDVKTIVASQVEVIEKLIAQGAMHIAWGTLPDLTITPCFQGSSAVERVHSYVLEHNALIVSERRRLLAEYPNVMISFADGYSALKLFFKHAEHFGFKVKDRGCTNYNIDGCSLSGGVPIQQGVFFKRNGEDVQICENPDEYFFWDAITAFFSI